MGGNHGKRTCFTWKYLGDALTAHLSPWPSWLLTGQELIKAKMSWLGCYVLVDGHQLLGAFYPLLLLEVLLLGK